MTVTAAVVLSGGLDSTVCMALAKRDCDDAIAVTFDYGQRHKVEVGHAAAVAGHYRAEHLVVPIDLRGWGGSALTDSSRPVPEDGGEGIPVTYVPARNLIFLSIASGIAEARDLDAIYIGVNALDYSGYPDCRPEFIESFATTAGLALKRGVEGRPVEIRSPLIALPKADIVRLGVEAGAPLHLTYSCYRGADTACGGCDSCRLRAAAFDAAGITDPRGVIISEVFGPTVQGEGPSIGQRCGFVRLGRCNLACDFCDTPFTWRWSDHDPAVELHEMSVDEIVGQLDAMNIDMLVISGGEPLLQQRDLRSLVGAVRTERGWRVEVETAGTIAPELDVDQWNVSPKLANSGNPLDRRYKPDVLGRFQATGRAVFKFVVADRGDLEEVADIVSQASLTNVWLMPEGTDVATIQTRLAWLAPAAVERGWNVTTRLHILIWGDERGR